MELVYAHLLKDVMDKQYILSMDSKFMKCIYVCIFHCENSVLASVTNGGIDA